MSNIFKSFHASAADVPTRQISIKNLNKPTEKKDSELKSDNSRLAEREQLIIETQKSLEAEKKRIEAMRETALADIQAMQSAWETEKGQLQQQAYEEGFQIGHSEGRDKAISDMQSAIAKANEITRKSKEIAEEYQANQERVILELAMKTAERILNETLKDDEEKFLSVVRRALIEVREIKEIKLYVSMDYYDLVASNRSELAAIFPPETPFLIFVNEDFNSTDCYVETNHGRIVVTIDDQLNELRESLIEALESEE